MKTKASKKPTAAQAPKKPASRERFFSSQVVDGVERAASRAMLYATGFKPDDFRKPQIGVASTWSMVTPCNIHIDQLAVSVAQGINEAGGKARGLQHHHHLRRHFDGHRGDEVFPRVARSDRRLHRDRGGLRRLRRHRGHRRLRQEHAGLPDGPGATESSRDLRLRRHDSARRLPRQSRWTSFRSSKRWANTRPVP